jgi:hypothetical protein
MLEGKLNAALEREVYHRARQDEAQRAIESLRRDVDGLSRKLIAYDCRIDDRGVIWHYFAVNGGLATPPRGDRLMISGDVLGGRVGLVGPENNNLVRVIMGPK